MRRPWVSNAWRRGFLQPGGGLFDRVVLLPGNHDHHLWEQAREAQYLDFIATSVASPGEALPPAYHTTGMFLDAKQVALPTSKMLTRLARRAAGPDAPVVSVAYPNHALVREVDGHERCVVFHHGHFIEPAYQLMSTLRTLVFPEDDPPQDVYALEAENFAWIDFFWSTLGRSGRVGANAETVYERMRDQASFRRLLDGLARELARRYDLPLVAGDWMEEKVIRWGLRLAETTLRDTERRRGSSESSPGGVPLSPSSFAGLLRYLNIYVRRQFRDEWDDRVPDRLSFVFGHTHKPFSRLVRASAVFRGRVAVYNTGGWVVDRVAPDSAYGCGLVLVDDNLNIVHLRMYNEGSGGKPYLEEALLPGDGHGPLFAHVREVMRRTASVWTDFARVVERSAAVRAENLRRRINRDA